MSTPEAQEPAAYHLNSTRSVAVGDHTYLPMESCPRGVKVILLNQGKVAVLGTYNGVDQWFGWYPLPKEAK